MSSGSVYSIKMVTSVFGCILVKGTWAAGNHHCRTGPLPVVRILGAIGYTSRSHFVSIDGSLNSVSNISGLSTLSSLARHGDKKQQRISSVLRPVVLSFIRAFCKTLRFSWIMHSCMLPVLYGPSLIRKMADRCPALHVHQISRNRKLLVHGCAERVARQYGRLAAASC
ncbi:hypothetical protein TNCV_1031941 [Trichonephila clavipes]|nr:hypothetical protein TNCV_1031941 [Trichonephila clavipes]